MNNIGGENVRSLVTSPIPGGYSWTLVSRLGHMLRLAEERFGSRDTSYTILGIEFEADGPQIWYPENCKHIAIQLTPDTATHMVKGCYQLAHECIHLLAPTGGRDANTLEEGLATFFAHKYVQDAFRVAMPATMPSYEIARQHVARLLAIDGNAVKRLREAQPTISKITAEQILSVCPSLEAEVAEALAARYL